MHALSMVCVSKLVPSDSVHVNHPLPLVLEWGGDLFCQHMQIGLNLEHKLHLLPPYSSSESLMLFVTLQLLLDVPEVVCDNDAVAVRFADESELDGQSPNDPERKSCAEDVVGHAVNAACDKTRASHPDEIAQALCRVHVNVLTLNSVVLKKCQELAKYRVELVPDLVILLR